MTLQQRRIWLMNESHNYMQGTSPPTINQLCYLITDLIESEKDIYIFCDSKTRAKLFKGFLQEEQAFLGQKLKIKINNELLTLKTHLACVVWVSPEDDILKSVGAYEYFA